MGFFKSLFGASSDSARSNEANNRPLKFAGKSQMDAAFIRAVLSDDADYVQALVNIGADVNAGQSNEHGTRLTALQMAVKVGANENVAGVIPLLIASGANVNAATNEGYTALYFAINHHLTDVMKMLLDAGANANAKRASGDTPLRFAIGFNHTEGVKLLIAANADVDEVNFMGSPVLMKAVEKSPEMTKMLIDGGAAVEYVADADGKTALFYCNNVETAQMLVDAGADVDAMDVWGYTLLANKARSNDLEMVKFLITAGASIDGSHSNVGITALHEAANYGHLEMVKELLAAGASIAARDKEGRDVLFHAVSDRDGHFYSQETRQKKMATAEFLRNYQAVQGK